MLQSFHHDYHTESNFVIELLKLQAEYNNHSQHDMDSAESNNRIEDLIENQCQVLVHAPWSVIGLCALKIPVITFSSWKPICSQ